MFIKKLTLKNFRSHFDSSFTFGKINLIRGPNNVGKSSVAQAIEYALTGRCPGTDERGVGADSLITRRKEAKAATITCEIAVNGGLPLIVERKRTHKDTALMITQNGQGLIGKPADEVLGTFFEKNLVSAALRAGRFLQLSKDAQAELLGDLLRPEAVEVEGDILEILELLNFKHAAGTKLTLEGARTLEEWAIRQRADCTGALRELGDVVEVPERKDVPTALQCQKRLDQHRMKQNSLVREKEGLLNKWQETQNKARTDLERLQRARAEALDLKGEAALMQALEDEPAVTKAEETLSRLRFEIADLDRQIKDAEIKAGKCPTCGHEVDSEDLVNRYKEGISARKSRIPTLEALVSKYEPMHVVREKLRKHREAVSDIVRLEKVLSETPAEVPQPDTSKLDAEIADIEDRMKRGQEIVAETAKYEADRAHYLAQVEKKKTLEARREAADRVAKWAAPTGIQAQMTGDKIGTFKNAVNEVMHLLGYDIQITEQANLILVGRFPIGAQFRPSELSESEQWRFSVAFQVAIAKVSGLGFVVLDRADVLVGENRSRFMQTIVDAGLDQVFVLASVDRKIDFPSEITVFDLELEEGRTIVA